MTHLNPEPKVINPELLLECARMAVPGKEWIDFGGWIACEGAYDAGPEFNPLTNDADAMKLGEVLERVYGWYFHHSDDYGFVAYYWWDYDHHDAWLKAESSPMRYFKCVSAQTGIPLYVESTP